MISGSATYSNRFGDLIVVVPSNITSTKARNLGDFAAFGVDITKWLEFLLQVNKQKVLKQVV